MSTPSDTPPGPFSDPLIPKPPGSDTQGSAPSPGPSTAKQASVVRLDDLFNFQIVVFQVENTLFQVLKNGFNVPGTIFEAMFALPSNESQSSLLEGNSLENPIHLPGIEEKRFRVFLRILYPFIGQSAVVEYEDWVGVLHLATMWMFKEIRLKAITALSALIPQKTILERISLARRYGVIEWLRQAYVELLRKTPLKLEELRESPSFGLDWEAIARLFYIQTQLAPPVNSNTSCGTCGGGYGSSYGVQPPCQCRCLVKVDEVFKAELEDLKLVDNVDDTDSGLPFNGSPLAASTMSGKKKKGKKSIMS